MNEFFIAIGTLLMVIAGGSGIFLQVRSVEDIAQDFAQNPRISAPEAVDKVKNFRRKFRGFLAILFTAGVIIFILGILGVATFQTNTNVSK